MKLIYLNGPLAGSSNEMNPRGTRIGRENDNDIQLLTNGVSRHHALVLKSETDIWSVQDLNSTNGTVVNGKRISGICDLKNEDILEIGDQSFRCVIDDGEKTHENLSVPTEQVVFFRPKASMKSSDVPLKTTSPSEIGIPLDSVTGQIKIFANKSKKEKETPSKEEKRKKMLNNLIFFFLVVVVAAIILGVFLYFNTQNLSENKPASNQPIKIVNPLILCYEKYVIQNTYVFKFTLHVENSHYEIILDEPNSNRHYYERSKEPIKKEILDDLRSKLEESHFMELKQETLVGSSQEQKGYRRIIAGFKSSFNNIMVTNDVSETFNRTEEIISGFLQDLNLDVFSQPVDTILEDAERALYVAEESYRNIDVAPGNLPKAIANFKIAAQRYKMFDPIPENGTRAIKGLEDASAKLEEIRKEGNRNVNLLIQQNEYEKAAAECARLMDIFPQDSETYRKIKEIKIKLEKKVNSRGN